MTRQTIDFGCDLGTTTSSIAFLNGTEPQVIPNRDGALFTPSAVWIDKRGETLVGLPAKDRYAADSANCDIEFKLRMRPECASGAKLFRDSGRKLTPAQLSAEVLKSLRADVQSHTGEDLRALVITVPADFDVPQNMQTEEAARLAGIEVSPLLHEPVAAALAYGFQSRGKDAYWLVYDFGGGTFDAAIVKVEDDFVQVVQHAGDNCLGGKLVDWDIVDKLLVPRVQEQTGIRDFHRMAEELRVRWAPQWGRLKYEAEKAKVEVSRNRRPRKIYVQEFMKDANGRTVDFDFELTPAGLQQIFDPYIARSLNLCQDALAKKGLKGNNLDRVILVGGTSLYPGLREAVQSEIGAKLDFSIDPVTVVARGAAVFAGTKRLRAAPTKPLTAREFHLALEYEPIGQTAEPELLGKVTGAAGVSLKGYTVGIRQLRSKWSSGRIELGAVGEFVTTGLAEEGYRNEFIFDLCDATGAACTLVPSTFPYTIGRPTTAMTLPHDIGVAQYDNTVDYVLKQGATTPARSHTTHHTVHLVRAGNPADRIRIPIVEGSHPRADRNRPIGYFEIQATHEKVRRDLPAGTEVQITVIISESGTIQASAHIPLLEEDFSGIFSERDSAKAESLQRLLDETCRRLADYTARAQKAEEAQALQLLGRIEKEQFLSQAKDNLAKGRADSNHVPEAERRILDFAAAVDRVEMALKWPDLVGAALKSSADCEQLLEEARIDEARKREYRTRLNRLKGQVEDCIKRHDPEALQARTAEIDSLYVAVLVEDPGFWMYKLQKHLATPDGGYTDAKAVQRLKAQGERAMRDDDIEGVKAAVRQLNALLRDESGAVEPPKDGPSTKKTR